jgi:hypothetical protein
MACSSTPAVSYAAKDRPSAIAEVAEKVRSEQGLQIYIHGANHDARTYVGTYTYDSFFDSLHLSLLSRDPEVRKTMGTLIRHDLVRVWGELLELESPQPHLRITRMVVEKKFTFPGEAHRPEVDWAKLAKEVASLNNIVVEVHAVADEGKILVVEYKGFVFPLFTRDFAVEAKDLSRQDFVRIHFKIQEEPGRPIHFELVEGPQKHAIELLDSIAQQNGQVKSIKGDLVMFPENPGARIPFNVFAIKVATEFGIARTYTVVNFKDADFFKAIRTKLQSAWDDGARENHAGCIFNDRNKLTNRCLEVEAHGTLNHVDPNQANPQVMVDKLDDLVIRDKN